MAVDITTERTISQPIDLVSAYAADPSNACEWYVNIRSVEWITPPPLAVGSRVAFVAKFLGRRLAYTYEIIDFVPGERLVMRTAQGPFPMETTYTWTSVGAATRPWRCGTRVNRPGSPGCGPLHGSGNAACQSKGPRQTAGTS